jgi:hypothetical protein
MKHRNRIATLAAAGLVIAGAAMASPATASGYFGFSIAAPGYYGAPVVVHSRAAGAYTAPYYGQPAYEDSEYGVPSYESEQYYSAGPSYYGSLFHSARVESYHRANFRNEERGHQSPRWNDNGRHGDHR